MIKTEAMAGETIHSAIKKAKEIAKTTNDTVKFKFNDCIVLVNSDTKEDLLVRDFYNHYLLEWKAIGPNTVPEYSKPTLEAIDAAEKAQQERQAEQEAQWKRQEEEQKRIFNEKVGETDLLLKDAKVWEEYVEKNQDPYGKCAVDYACDWGILMQYYMANGETLEQCADRASHELGWYGITGFMYGCAVQMLSQCWKFGEELRKWHNKEYNHEGDGVVNPAILTINPK